MTQAPQTFTQLDPAKYPVWLKDMIAWINSGGKLPMYDIAGGHPGEGGVDLSSPEGTPVLALATGPLIAVSHAELGGSCYGGVVTQRINVPGYGVQDIYYQHVLIDLPECGGVWKGNCVPSTGADVACGVLTAGTKIGTVGSIGEVEVGFNSGWGGPYGTNHPDVWRHDPEKLIASLIVNGNSAYTGGPSSSTTYPPQLVGAAGLAGALLIGVGVLALGLAGMYLWKKVA